MMKMQPIQYGFAAGELTNRLLGNTQAEVYKNGVAELYNMIPLAHGPASARDGSLFLDEAGNADDIRMIPFNVSRSDNYVIEFGPLYLRIYDASGRVSIGGQNHINDPVFLREFLFWNDVSTGGNITFSHEAQAVRLNNLTGSNIAAINQKTEDVMAGHIGTAHTITGSFAGDGQLHIEVGTAEGLADILDVTVSVPGDFSFALVPTTIINWIEFTNSGASNTTAIVQFPKFKKDGVTIELVTPYTAEDLPELQYEMIGSTGTLVIVHADHPPKELVLLPDVDFQFLSIVFVSEPTNWVANNYPNVVTIFQGRLWLARTPNKLNTVWASQSGDYFNFDKGTGLANEAIEVELASQGEIQWMKGQKDLLMGTFLGEHRISAQNGIITPSDIDIRQQSAYGSARLVQSQNIGDQVLYVSHDGRKVRALTFDAFQQGWYSPDLTWIAEHITSIGITEIHFARDPSTLVLCLLTNGTVAVCTYDKSQQSLGWSLFDLAGLDIKSLAVIDGEFGSTIIGAGKQDNGKMVILVSPGVLGVPAYMDSAITRPIESGNIVTGLDHLEGLTVSIKVNGAVHPDKVVSGGQVTLDFTDSTALVGLGYNVRLKTLPLDVGSSNGSGSGNLKHWAKIYVRIIDSSMPLINGVRPPTRSPSTPMDEAEPLKTETIQATDLGRTRNAQITIEQNLPLKLEILNLFGIEGQDRL